MIQLAARARQDFHTAKNMARRFATSTTQEIDK